MTWIDEEAKRLEAERKKKRDELGLKEFYRFEQGENTLEFNTSVAPKPIVSEFGNRIAIDAKANGKDYIVTMNPSGILYELLVQQFKKGKSKITIIRTGEGMKTRYAVK